MRIRDKIGKGLAGLVVVGSMGLMGCGSFGGKPTQNPNYWKNNRGAEWDLLGIAARGAAHKQSGGGRADASRHLLGASRDIARNEAIRNSGGSTNVYVDNGRGNEGNNTNVQSEDKYLFFFKNFSDVNNDRLIQREETFGSNGPFYEGDVLFAFLKPKSTWGMGFTRRGQSPISISFQLVDKNNGETIFRDVMPFNRVYKFNLKSGNYRGFISSNREGILYTEDLEVSPKN